MSLRSTLGTRIFNDSGGRSPATVVNDAPASGIDPATGMPYRPKFQSIFTPGGGLASPYSAEAGTANFRSLSTDTNPWMQLQNQRISGEQNDMRDRAMSDANVGLGTGMSQLASSGGIDSGARERLMTSSDANRMRSLSGIGQQGAASRLDAGIQAEQMKRQAEQFNADAFNRNSMFNTDAANRMSTFNAGNAINGMAGQNAFNMEMYGQDMGAWGAAKTAEAQAAAANKKKPLFGIGGAGSLGSWDAVGNAIDRGRGVDSGDGVFNYKKW